MWPALLRGVLRRLGALQGDIAKRQLLPGLLLAVFVLGMTVTMVVFAIAVLSLQIQQEGRCNDQEVIQHAEEIGT